MEELGLSQSFTLCRTGSQDLNHHFIARPELHLGKDHLGCIVGNASEAA